MDRQFRTSIKSKRLCRFLKQHIWDGDDYYTWIKYVPKWTRVTSDLYFSGLTDKWYGQN